MELSDTMEELLDLAEATVRKRLKTEGLFQAFALVVGSDGGISEKSANGREELGPAIGELLKSILPMVNRKELTATLICTPIPPEQVADAGWRAAMFDIEDRDHLRAYVVMPYRERSYGGWEYRPMEFTRGVAQVFPR